MDRFIDLDGFADHPFNPGNIVLLYPSVLEFVDRFFNEILVAPQEQHTRCITIEPVQQLGTFDGILYVVAVHLCGFVDRNDILILIDDLDVTGVLDTKLRLRTQLCTCDLDLLVTDKDQTAVDQLFGFFVGEPFLLCQYFVGFFSCHLFSFIVLFRPMPETAA